MRARETYRSSLALIPLVAGLLGLTMVVSAQSVQPTGKNGEWPAYAGDLSNYRYSPLDQINAANFSKLEVAWRFKTDNLGTRPEYKLEGTPIMVKGVVYATAGTRRGCGRAGCRHRRVAVGPRRARRRARRSCSAPTFAAADCLIGPTARATTASYM